ncbi:TPA: hypothetical protein ACIPUI_002676 [Citrobacter freundii]
MTSPPAALAKVLIEGINVHLQRNKMGWLCALRRDFLSLYGNL